MDDIALKSFIEAEIKSAIGYEMGDVSQDRATALEYYHGEKVGIFAPVDDDHSSVVSRDVQEVVELMMPALMKTFSGEILKFDPVGKEDIDLAEQETDYVNYIFNKKNDGWFITYQWIKDALLQKNGVVKAFWEEEEEIERFEYHNLTEQVFMYLSQQDGVEVKRVTVNHVMPDGAIMEGEDPMYPPVYDAVFELKKKSGEIEICNVAPENYGINADHYNICINDANFFYERSYRTVTELLELGYDESEIENLPKGNSVLSDEGLARTRYVDEELTTDSTDKSMETVEFYEIYCKVDYDGDGKAERRKICYAGNVILSNEEVDRFPYVAITPIIMPHRFFGLSLYDRVCDLQEIKTAIWRNALDNIYQSVNQRLGVNDKVNLDDALNTRPNGVIRTEGDAPPSQNIHQITMQPIVDQAFQMLDYTDKIRQGRTGVSQVDDLSDDLLSNNKGDMSVARIMSLAEQQVELIARTFAETGFKELFLLIHELALKHQNKKDVVELRGKWVEVSPAEWKDRKNVTVRVGLGTDEKQKQIAGIQNVIMQQKEYLQLGKGVLVSDENIYSAVRDFTRFADLDGTKYFTDPNKMLPNGMTVAQAAAQAAAQQGPSDTDKMLMVQREIEQIKAESRREIEGFRAQLQQKTNEEKLALEYKQKTEELQMKYETDMKNLAAKLTELELKYLNNVPGSLV